MKICACGHKFADYRKGMVIFMDENSNPKLENLLSLALEASADELKKSQILETGVDTASGIWEVIVKYNGDLERLSSDFIKVETLINGYAIVTLHRNLIEAFSNLDEVEFIEMPKRLYFE